MAKKKAEPQSEPLLGTDGASAPPPAPPPPPPPPEALTPDAPAAEAAVDAALDQAQASLSQLQDLAQPMSLPDLAGSAGQDDPANSIAMLGDVELQVVVELGRTHMLVEDVLRLSEGSIVELDKLAGDPVDVYVNQRLIARGEVLVLNDSFCIRISEIVADLEEQASDAARQELAST
jgi:flagellar motor switch protein FliN